MQKMPLARLVLLIVALTLPALGAWLYYSVLSETHWAGAMYLCIKISMIALGILGWKLSKTSLFASWKVSRQQALVGFATGLAMSAFLAIAYVLLDQHLAPFADMLRFKTASLFPLAWYGVVGVIFSTVHAFFEEWYWRAFVNSELHSRMRPMQAMIVGSIAFSAHHAIVLGQIFTPHLVLLMSIGIFTAGLFWSYLVKKTSSLTPGWISHIVVDGMIFILGAMLMF